MKNLIKSQKFITCPWGGWGLARQNVVDGIFNDHIDESRGRPSNGQDRRFVEDMRIGDIVLIPFAKGNGCLIARITSDVDYAINSGLHWNEEGNQIKIDNTGRPFRPVGRYIEVIRENFIPNRSLGQWSLSKMNKELVARLNNL